MLFKHYLLSSSIMLTLSLVMVSPGMCAPGATASPGATQQSGGSQNGGTDSTQPLTMQPSDVLVLSLASTTPSSATAQVGQGVPFTTVYDWTSRTTPPVKVGHGRTVMGYVILVKKPSIWANGEVVVGIPSQYAVIDDDGNYITLDEQPDSKKHRWICNVINPENGKLTKNNYCALVLTGVSPRRNILGALVGGASLIVSSLTSSSTKKATSALGYTTIAFQVLSNGSVSALYTGSDATIAGNTSYQVICTKPDSNPSALLPPASSSAPIPAGQ